MNKATTASSAGGGGGSKYVVWVMAFSVLLWVSAVLPSHGRLRTFIQPFKLQKDFVLCNEGDILPQIILDPNMELPVRSNTSSGVAVLMTSLTSAYFYRVRDLYWKHKKPTVDTSQRAMSIVPCFMHVSSDPRHSCNMRTVDAGGVVRQCEDINWGLELL